MDAVKEAIAWINTQPLKLRQDQEIPCLEVRIRKNPPESFNEFLKTAKTVNGNPLIMGAVNESGKYYFHFRGQPTINFLQEFGVDLPKEEKARAR